MNILAETNICIEGGTAQIIEKKSRFIANIMPVNTQEEAALFIESIKKEYWDAGHNCYAFIVEDGKIQRFSDDGEPAKTAGVPMLDILNNKNIENICVVVTRYFGGILLGTGALVRAYQTATLEGLKQSKIGLKKYGYFYQINMDYDLYGKIRYIADEYNISILNTKYEENIKLEILMPVDKADGFIEKVKEETAARIYIEKRDIVEYVIIDNAVKLL